MKPTDEQRRWQLVLDDPQSPPELRAKAAKHLAIQIPVSGNYAPELDHFVESYWGAKKDEEEQWHPVAEKVYHAVTGLTLLGGVPNTVVADIETVLDAFAACKSDAGDVPSALNSALLLPIDCPKRFKGRIKAALDSVTDFDVLQEPEERTTTG